MGIRFILLQVTIQSFGQLKDFYLPPPPTPVWSWHLHQKSIVRTSMVVQKFGIHLPVWGTWVRSLVQEDPTCCRAAEHGCHNYCTCVLEPVCHSYWAHKPQVLESVCPTACGLQQEKPPQWETHALQLESSPHLRQLEESPCSASKTQRS